MRLVAGTYALVVLGPLLFGGVPGWASATIIVAALLLGALVLTADVPRTPLLARVLGVGVAAVGLTAFQRIPLPLEVVRAIAPRAAAAEMETATALGRASSAFIPLTLDPAATTEEIAKGIALLFATLLGAALCARRGSSSVSRAIALSGVTLTLVSWAHPLLGLTSVYGVYQPLEAHPRLLSPLLNENHLSGVLVLAAPAALGLGLGARETRERALWFAAMALMAGTVVFTVSRGGVAALLLGTALSAGMFVLRRRTKSASARSVAIAALAVLATTLGLAIGACAALDALLDPAVFKDRAKIDLFYRAADLVSRTGFLGVGRGAFSVAMVPFYGSTARYEYPENILLQWSSEWGVPFTCVLVLMLVYVVRSTFDRAASPARMGLWCGVVALFAQNLVDFSLEMIGISVLMAVSVGALTMRRQTRDPGALRTWPVSRARAVAAPALAIAALLAIDLPARRVNALAGHLRAAMFDADPARFDTLLAQAVELHPAEPVLALLASVDAARRADPGALRWANRAMMLAPGWTAPHVLAAQWLLANRHEDQALLEFRQVGTVDPGLAASAVCAMPAAQHDPGLIVRAAPTLALEYLQRVGLCPTLAPATREAIDQEILTLDSSDRDANLRLAFRLSRADSMEESLRALDRILTEHWTARVSLARAQILADHGRLPEALEELDRAEQRMEDAVALWPTRARCLALAGQLDAAREVVDRLRGRAAGDSAKIAVAWTLLGEIEQNAENYARALYAYEQADAVSGQHPYLLTIGRLAERVGDSRRALGAYQAACNYQPNGAACTERERVRAQLASRRNDQLTAPR